MKVLQSIYTPQESVNDQSLIVVGLNFQDGDFVKKNDIVIELETSKAVTTIEASTDGYIKYNCSLDDEVAVNSLIVEICDVKPETADQVKAEHNVFANVEVGSESLGKKEFTTQYSRKALELIKKYNLSAELFKDHDFVNEESVLNYMEPGREKATLKEASVAQPVSKLPERVENAVYEKLSAGKKREIEYLSSVYNNGLVSTLYITISAKKVLSVLNKKLSYFRGSILPVVVLETSRLLLKYPLLNAFFNNNQIGKYTNVNIGIAFDIEDGLKVVKLPDTEKSGIFQIEEKIFELSNKYLDKKLSVNDLSDITFTITDISGTGVSFFAPLINKNNSAILGIAKMNDSTGNYVISLSFDHRVTEGKYAGNFLAELKSRVESFWFEGEDVGPLEFCYKCLKELTEDLNEKGFIKVQTKGGEEKLICDTCLFNY